MYDVEESECKTVAERKTDDYFEFLFIANGQSFEGLIWYGDIVKVVRLGKYGDKTRDHCWLSSQLHMLKMSLWKMLVGSKVRKQIEETGNLNYRVITRPNEDSEILHKLKWYC